MAGHFSLSGGSLTIGSGILGLALPHRDGKLTPPAALLIVFALLNVLCQFFTPIPSFFGNITAAVLFLTLGWLGVSAWSSKHTDAASSEGGEIDTDLPSDETFLRKKRGLAISCPSESVANVVSPTSMPTCSGVSGKRSGSHSTEKHTDHLPVLLLWMVQVLMLPLTSRW